MADDLRTRIAEALRGAPVHATAMRLHVLTDVYGPVDTMADAVLALVQPELDRLRTENTVLHQALREHESCSACGHERHQHERDPILRAEWCRACTTLDDLHDFTPTTEETPS